LSTTNFLNEIGAAHSGQQAFWGLRIGSGILMGPKLSKGMPYSYCLKCVFFVVISAAMVENYGKNRVL
jgi:hypothetical protein